MAPILIEYKMIKFKALTWEKLDDQDDELRRRIRSFHEKSAPRLVDLVLRMGGIYIKIGQVMSTIGQGLLPQEYLLALEPLQNGVPPRDYDSVARIIEASSGKKMSEIFRSFDEKPVGSASIAQAHRAKLVMSNANYEGTGGGSPDDEDVIVKVQYPEVEELFEADLNNMELATKLFAPENVELVRALRERHSKELDFRVEADNLRECRRNMQRHGVEPAFVRIPRVRNETGLCTRHVLVMEYLEGTSLSEVIAEEQTRMAAALGKADLNELRTDLARRMREHFEQGGGDSNNAAGARIAASGPGLGGLRGLLGGGGGGGGGAPRDGPAMPKMVQVSMPMLALLLRTYVGLKERADRFFHAVQSSIGRLGGDRVAPTARIREVPSPRSRINLSRVLKTLIYVHGLQMLRDGVYNADPHPVGLIIIFSHLISAYRFLPSPLTTLTFCIHRATLSSSPMDALVF